MNNIHFQQYFLTIKNYRIFDKIIIFREDSTLAPCAPENRHKSSASCSAEIWKIRYYDYYEFGRETYTYLLLSKRIGHRNGQSQCPRSRIQDAAF